MFKRLNAASGAVEKTAQTVEEEVANLRSEVSGAIEEFHALSATMRTALTVVAMGTIVALVIAALAVGRD